MKKITPETMTRTVILFIAVINQALTTSGYNPLDIAESDIYMVVTVITSVTATIWAWWKNNSFTKEAIEADMCLKELKSGKCPRRA